MLQSKPSNITSIHPLSVIHQPSFKHHPRLQIGCIAKIHATFLLPSSTFRYFIPADANHLRISWNDILIIFFRPDREEVSRYTTSDNEKFRNLYSNYG